MKWDGGSSTRGDGGFSAIGGNATVTLVTAVGGSTAASPVWNAGGFVSNGYALTMGSTQADSRIDFTNNIGLDDGTATNNYFAREIRVADNPLSLTDMTRLSGIISGSANADLLKTGAGLLELTGANTYAGNTLIQQGTLAIGAGGSIANSANIVDNAAFDVSNATGGYTLGAGQTLKGNGSVLGAMIAAGTIAPGNSIGTLTFNNNVTLTGTLSVEVSGSGSGSVDLIQGIGNLNITGGTVDFSLLSPLDDSAYVFAKYTTLTGSHFATVLDLPTGYAIDYDYQNGNQIALTAITTPEPGTLALLLAAGVCSLATLWWRKRSA